ncbi:cis-golgi transport protein particle complex subunit [Truncatella angustata]|uniref:Cis-golgi transport protein particle complex subunit n=1 Tax=Truncatella angustata TaxID=152316 RepID=A0A9P9A0Y7_9PEZI|nr:cis-golgi transport protein particle complex subunit [Truncatella angustata]KAH6657559.1 cis-golgi transport protein particle complex subunit [Truncatella angustata]
MEQPFSTSKVTVEYFDPHGVYKLLAPGLIPRLPLRNLHWQSHAGPLRSIDTLHIELSPEGSVDPKPIFSPDPFFPNSQRTDSPAPAHPGGNNGFQTQIGATSAEPANAQQPADHRSSTPARRHQIPGLRTTPYLKVLLVRCDDSDSYKSTVRQEIRDWIKAQAPSTSTKKSTAENHDAFEWLILHVVVPNTAAAAQSRVTGKSEAAAPTSTSRWRPGSTTLLEKLRADFNSSSKGATDRIAQIRIGVNDVPYDILPRITNIVPSSYKETADEIEAVWDDLISKMRSLILSSFDMRVSQYEDDIKEKDNQRSLPGWNFCTFFILKEGLARGFESVGLVEDALVGYDELSVGLDMVIKEQTVGESGASTNALLAFTEELKEAAEKAITEASGEDAEDEVVNMQASSGSAPRAAKVAFDEIPISATKKPYRDLILENKVSVFDFRCYIFARQIALLQRLGNVWSTREELLAKLKEQQESIIHGVAPRAPPPKHTENEQEDLSMLAEICRRTLEFIPSVSQVMRNDVQLALAQRSGLTDARPASLTPALVEIVDNLVASFAFSIAQQVLAQTSTKALPIPPTALAPSDGHEQKANIPEPKTMMHPARNSSLRVSTGPTNIRPPASPNVFPGPGQNSALSEHQAAKNNVFLKVGLEELAARRAELYTLSRNILEEAGKKREWSDGWAGVPVIGETSMIDLVEISLDDDPAPANEEPGEHQKAVISVSGLENKLLRASLSSSEDFYRLYETLTDKALRHYTVANHTYSVQGCMADLAVLKYHLKDYGTASSFFWRTTPFFGESGWSLLELSMLVMYSRCLKQLSRKDDFVKVMLKLLSKASAAERDRQKQQRSFRIGKQESAKYPDNDAIKGFLDDLLSETRTNSNEVRVPLSNFFSTVEVDETVDYHDGRDSFSATLKLSSLLVDDLRVEKAKARMVGQIAGAQREVWLELPEPVTIKSGWNKLKLDSSVTIPGNYEFDRIELIASNICLHLERNINQPAIKSSECLKSSRLTIYHRADALDVRLLASNHVQLDKNNSVDVELNSGWNELTNAEIKVKGATGGLRLLTSEAKVINSSAESPDFSKAPEAGLFSFDWIKPRTKIKIRFPYTVENEVSTISVRIEVAYKTSQGSFQFSTTPSIPVSLALGVNVQDVFKHKALLSRFTVSTANQSPLRLLRSELISSDIFESKYGLAPSDPTVIFPRQPATLLYKILRKRGVKVTKKINKTLYLKLDYTIVQEDIAITVQKSIEGALKGTPLQTYSRLLASTILPHVEHDLRAFDLERTALLGAVSTDFLSAIDWNSQLMGLGKGPDGQDLSATLRTFLRAWLAEHKTLVLQQMSTSDDEVKSILIPVEIPSIDVVHTADIRLQPPPYLAPPTSSEHADTPLPLTTNQLVPATLRLKWTRIWDTVTPLKDMSDMEFSYDVTSPGDAWLIGGRRKGHFVILAPSQSEKDLSSSPETEADIPLLLIPQREGYLAFPNVDIREVRPNGPGDSTTSGSEGVTPVEGESGHCETDLRNLGETVRVVADREQVTLSLDASGPGGGPLVLAIQTKGESGRIVA